MIVKPDSLFIGVDTTQAFPLYARIRLGPVSIVEQRHWYERPEVLLVALLVVAFVAAVLWIRRQAVEQVELPPSPGEFVFHDE